MDTATSGHPVIRGHFLKTVSYLPHVKEPVTKGLLSCRDTFSWILRCPLKTGYIYNMCVHIMYVLVYMKIYYIIIYIYMYIYMYYIYIHIPIYTLYICSRNRRKTQWIKHQSSYDRTVLYSTSYTMNFTGTITKRNGYICSRPYYIIH